MRTTPGAQRFSVLCAPSVPRMEQPMSKPKSPPPNPAGEQIIECSLQLKPLARAGRGPRCQHFGVLTYVANIFEVPIVVLKESPLDGLTTTFPSPWFIHEPGALKIGSDLQGLRVAFLEI